MLSDGHATYTAGLSENRGGTKAYYSNDRLGNLWTLDGTSKNQLAYEDNAGFGSLVAGGSGGTPFGFGGGNGCLTDADTGLVLMGHRYYDPRQGRFISQDPIGDGDNWYAYADNSPTNEIDPSGFVAELDGSLTVPGDWSTEDITNFLSDNYQDGEYKVTNGTGSYNITIDNSFSNFFMQGGMGLNMGDPGMGGGMFANHTKNARKSTKGPHEIGIARGNADKLKTEKGDKQRLAAENAKKALKTGVSTRDPDGSVRRAREATQEVEMQEERFESRPMKYGKGFMGDGEGAGGGAAVEGGAAAEEGVTAEEVIEIIVGGLLGL